MIAGWCEAAASAINGASAPAKIARRDGRDARALHAVTQLRVAHRDVRADDEHQQREPDVGEEREGRLVGTQRAGAGGADQHPRRDLADHDRRRERLGSEREQRPEQADRDDERERAVIHASEDPGFEAGGDRQAELVGLFEIARRSGRR